MAEKKKPLTKEELREACKGMKVESSQDWFGDHPEQQQEFVEAMHPAIDQMRLETRIDAIRRRVKR